MAPNVRRWRFPASSQYVAHARHVAAAHARWLGADARDVALAVSEAFTNAVVHAYPNTSTEGEVELVMRRRSTQLEVRVSDDGQVMLASASQASPGLGLGLSVIKQLTVRLDVEQMPQGGTKVRMYFPLE